MSAPQGSAADAAPRAVNESVAHSIIADFVAELQKREGFAEIAKALDGIIYKSPSEASLRAALFGDETI
jgi:hypothetical protein